VAAVVCAAAFVAVSPHRFAVAADAPQPLEVVSVDTSAAPNVKVTVSVPRELTGKTLSRNDFTVVEAGRRRLPTLTRLPSDALAVVLAIDTSGSMAGSAIAAARNAAEEFVQKMPAGTQVAVIGFSGSPYVASPFTTDRNALTAAISGLQANGETALYDAVSTGAAQLATTGGARRALVLLSDGGDTTSTATLAAAGSSLATANASFYAAALLTGETDMPALTQLASSGGGRVVSASDPAGLSGLYDEIATSITNQYQLSFRATSSGTTTLRLGVDADGVHAATDVTVDVATPAPVARVRTHPVEVTTASAPLFGGADWALAAGAVAVFLALLAGGLLLFAPRARPSTLAADRPRGAARRHDRAIGDLVGSASRFAEQTLERRGKRRTLNDALERAGIDMRPGEFSVLVAGVTIAALFVGLLLAGPLFGLALGVVSVVVFRSAVSIKAEKRRAKFADQLGDTLQLMAGSLRSGHGLVQAVDTVAEESESPTRDEFRRVVIETRLGKSLYEALQAAAARVRNEDFDWTVQAMAIHREIGGDLAEVLDQVAATIRSRNSVRRQVQALSAEGRLSAWILLFLPIGLTGIIWIQNPDYLAELTNTSAGNVMIVVGVGLLVVGGLWMRKLIRVVY
jgi:tight adherence protein B